MRLILGLAASAAFLAATPAAAANAEDGALNAVYAGLARARAAHDVAGMAGAAPGLSDRAISIDEKYRPRLSVSDEIRGKRSKSFEDGVIGIDTDAEMDTARMLHFDRAVGDADEPRTGGFEIIGQRAEGSDLGQSSDRRTEEDHKLLPAEVGKIDRPAVEQRKLGASNPAVRPRRAHRISPCRPGACEPGRGSRRRDKRKQ